MIRTCPACEKEFNTSDFGRGKKFCSLQCRIKKDSTEPLRSDKGRPSRFPRVGDGEAFAIKQWLKDKGFDLKRGDHPDEWYNAKCFYAHKGYNQFRICIGGGTRIEQWAHLVIYHDLGGVHVASTCIRAKREKIARSGKKYQQRTACRGTMKKECLKCAQTEMFRRASGLIEIKYDGAGNTKRKYIYAKDLPLLPTE